MLWEKIKPNYTALSILVVIALIMSILALVSAIRPGTNNNTDACTLRLEQIETRMDEIEKVQSWQTLRMGDISQRGRGR